MNCSRRQTCYDTGAAAIPAARGSPVSDENARDRRRLVLGAAVGFRIDQVRVFVESLRAAGYAGDVIMLVGLLQWRLRPIWPGTACARCRAGRPAGCTGRSTPTGSRNSQNPARRRRPLR